MMMKAVVTSAAHPEFGAATIPFPIPDNEYDHTLERLEGSEVNVDELDYLAKQLDRFCESEDSQFLTMAHKLDLSGIKDFIGLTFCCQQATVITDFSDLDRVGRDHCMNINGGSMPTEEYGRYMIRESGHFDYDANLEGFYDYRPYGEQHVRQEGGQFNECGYVAYRGTLPLEDLMRDDPAEQYQREQGMQML